MPPTPRLEGLNASDDFADLLESLNGSWIGAEEEGRLLRESFEKEYQDFISGEED